MVETILRVDGMMCGMCESHINDVVRKTARVNKVTSSHTKGETVIVSEQPVDVEALKAAIAEMGYTVTGVQTRPYEKKGFFSFLKSNSPVFLAGLIMQNRRYLVMRILVYGAGVQGCQLAHSLAQNKKNVVTLLARGEWKEVIDQKGLTIRHMLQRKTTVDRMQTTDVLAPEDVYDLVFVTVQAGQLADVLPILKANRSQYFIFVGNDPYAQEMLQAMQRPVDKIAFGFQNNAGRREHDRLVSVHMGMGMTVGGATAPLSGAFRLRLQAAFEGTHYKLTYYSDMDEWLKSHIAFILPCAYACYAVDGELSRTTVEQRRMIVDAAWECCEMLKAAGVPVNDAENTDRYREGTKQRKKTERMVYWMAQTVVGKWCISDHAMRAVSEMQYLDEAFAALRATTLVEMTAWDELRRSLPRKK